MNKWIRRDREVKYKDKNLRDTEDHSLVVEEAGGVPNESFCGRLQNHGGSDVRTKNDCGSNRRNDEHIP